MNSWLGSSFNLISSLVLTLVHLSVLNLSVVTFVEASVSINMVARWLVYSVILTMMAEELFLFYILFEMTMIPTLILIMEYGGQISKLKAAYYVVGYVVTMSLPFIMFIMMIEDGVSSFFDKWVISIILMIMLVKVPAFGLHLWLPQAHVEASTTGSMLLAGVLLKLGVYSLISFGQVFKFVNMYLLLLSGMVGMVVGGFLSNMSSDSKMLVAYSSITHMNGAMMVIMTQTSCSESSGLTLSVAHGFTSTLIFYMMGELYHYNGSRIIYYNMGVSHTSPFKSMISSLAWLSNVGLPIFISFFGELTFFTSLLNIYPMFVYGTFIYYMITFTYSIYMMMNSMKSGNYVGVNPWAMTSLLLLNIMSANILLLIL